MVGIPTAKIKLDRFSGVAIHVVFKNEYGETISVFNPQKQP